MSRTVGRPVGGPGQQTLLLLLGAALVALAVLTLLVADGTGWLRGVDRGVARWGYDATHGHRAATDLWLGVAGWGQPMVLRGVLVLTALVLGLRGARRPALWLVVVTVVELVVAPLSKTLLERARPSWPDPITVLSSASYPSGHATAAGLFVACGLLLVMTASIPPTLRWASSVVVVAVGLLITIDRIFLGVHYLSDVVAGNLLGGAIGLAGWLLLVRPPVEARADPPAG